MPEEATAAPGPVFRKWLEYGCPVIAGGDDEARPEHDEPQDEPVEPEGPERESAADEPEGDEPIQPDGYNPDEIPEDLREYANGLEKRFKAAYTRRTQGLAEERKRLGQYEQFVAALQDPEQRQAIFKQYGWDQAPGDEEDYDWQGAGEDEESPTDPRVDALVAQNDARMEVDFILDEIGGLEDELGYELHDDEADAIADLARSRRRQDGVPDVRGAYKLISGLEKVWKERYRESKTKTPRPPGVGLPASKRAELDNPEARLEAARSIADQVFASG